jgi:hypothetical protein
MTQWGHHCRYLAMGLATLRNPVSDPMNNDPFEPK